MGEKGFGQANGRGDGDCLPFLSCVVEQGLFVFFLSGSCDGDFMNRIGQSSRKQLESGA